MTLAKLNKLFWDYFLICPRKACLTFSKNPIFGVRPTTYKFLTIEQLKYSIFEETTNLFFKELIEKKEISLPKLKEIFYALILKKEQYINNNSKYSNSFKENFLKMTSILKKLDEFNDYISILNPSDANNLNIGLKTDINISTYANRKLYNDSINSLKKDYIYEFELPFYKDDKLGEYTAIKYIHSGYPNDILEFNPELILTKTFFNKCVTNGKLKDIIIYDFKTMIRYKIKSKEFKEDFNQIFKKLKIMENNLVFCNNSFENCKNCPHINFCKNSYIYKQKFEKLI